MGHDGGHWGQVVDDWHWKIREGQHFPEMDAERLLGKRLVLGEEVEGMEGEAQRCHSVLVEGMEGEVQWYQVVGTLQDLHFGVWDQ